MGNTKNATVIKTGKEISVYKHRERGTWINAHDCDTEYKPNELNFK